jgi:hypothetical protein
MNAGTPKIGRYVGPKPFGVGPAFRRKIYACYTGFGLFGVACSVSQRRCPSERTLHSNMRPRG